MSALPVHRDYQVRAATEADARALALRLRPDDAAEVAATSHLTADEGLLSSLRGSLGRGGEAWTLLLQGEVAAVWGVAPLTELDQDTGVVWMLTAQVVERHRRLFAELSRVEVRALLKRWPVLLNHIDARYTRALRWAAWTGAQLMEPRPWGVAGLPFVPAVWRAC